MTSDGTLCDYCKRQAELVGAEKIYPHRPDLAGKWFWRCVPCGAYVGCHPGTQNPLGRLADAALRRAKQRVHRVLDPLWKSGKMSRKDAYKQLSDRLGIASARGKTQGEYPGGNNTNSCVIRRTRHCWRPRSLVDDIIAVTRS